MPKRTTLRTLTVATIKRAANAENICHGSYHLHLSLPIYAHLSHSDTSATTCIAVVMWFFYSHEIPRTHRHASLDNLWSGMSRESRYPCLWYDNDIQWNRIRDNSWYSQNGATWWLQAYSVIFSTSHYRINMPWRASDRGTRWDRTCEKSYPKSTSQSVNEFQVWRCCDLRMCQRIQVGGTGSAM